MTAKEPQIEELLDHRDEIEASVSAHLGHEWGISEIQDLAEKSSHPSAVLSDGEFGVLAKLGRGRCAAEQFRCETVGLSAISMAGVLTPTVVDCFQPVPEILFSAYAEILPIDTDFPNRRELWRMPFYLAMVEGHEGIPQDQIRAVLDRFL